MPDHTFSEILSQPSVWGTVSRYVENNKTEFETYFKRYQRKKHVFIGSGTSYYMAMSAASVYSKVTEEETQAVSSSDILFFPELIFPRSKDGYAAMLISRSGATTEVLRAGEIVDKQMGLLTCVLTCRSNSELLTYGDRQFVLDEADEKSVVMTRSFTSMLLLIQFLAAIKAKNQKYAKELSLLPEKGESILENFRPSVKEIMRDTNVSKFVYLGQGPYYGLACESMLKIKEMSNASAEAFHSLEYRHGPMATADNRTLITFFLSDKARSEETTLIKEMSKLGAKILVLCEYSDDMIETYADYIIDLRSGLSEFARLLLYMPFTQLMAYDWSVSNGLDPDNPRNLTQVVTLK